MMRITMNFVVLLGLGVLGAFATPTPGDKVGVFRGNSDTALWLLDANGSGQFENLTVDKGFFFGGLTEQPTQPLVGDWDGSGTKKVGVRHGCFFILDYNGNGQWDSGIDAAIYACLPANATVVVGDWSGDGRDKLGYFYNGVFFLDANSSGTFATIVVLGQQGDIPVVGDWNGDKRTKVGVFRDGLWVLDYNGNGLWDGPLIDSAFGLGKLGDRPIVGDWNGDGRKKAGIFRLQTNSPFGPSSTLWVLDYNGNQNWDGIGADRAYFVNRAVSYPVLGDWSNEGRTKVGFFENGTFTLDVTGDGSFTGIAYLGQTGDLPISGKW